MTTQPRPSRRVRRRLLLVTLLASIGCAADHRNPISDDSRRNVMVIDDGIDPDAPQLQGKVAALYTIACHDDAADADAGAGAGAGDADGGAGGDADGGAGAFDRAKAKLLAELDRTDESCHLREGIAAKPPVFPELSDSQRAQWNSGLTHDQSLQAPPLSDLAKIFGNDDFPAATSFHGTSTSGVIAFDGPELRMVLVEEVLGDPGAVGQEFDCLDQADVDQTVALYSDPDVRAAYLRRPLASVDRELAGVRAAHAVGLVNESFGPLSRTTIEALQIESCGSEIVIGPYLGVMGELMRAYDDAHAEPGVLIVRAAGNDGQLLQGPEDQPFCRIGDPHQLLVGSYDLFGEKSTFTNFGPCVDIYAPGELVVAPMPGNFLFPLSGTSFASPMLLRVMLSTSPAPFAPDSARAAILALRAPNGAVPFRAFPSDLIYDPNHVAATSALVATGAPVLTSVVVGRPRAPGARALARVLGPIRWTRRHRPAP